jgi:hydrophobic/amphiphilic exporter-1 (mainly G- bacteria), HAE1 family
MTGLYQSPFRVYFALLAIAICGVIAGFNLPISLFPNSSKPTVYVSMRYPGLTATEFSQNFGGRFEHSLEQISFGDYKVEKLHAHYNRQDVSYEIEFQWGTPAREAVEQVAIQANSFANQFPSKEMRDSLYTWNGSGGTGFLAVSMYSTTRSLDELYDYLDPILTPRLAKVDEADERELWNPERKEIRVELNPEKMAALHIFPTDIEDAVDKALQEYGGGKLTTDQNSFQIRMTRPAKDFSDLAQTVVTSRSGAHVYLHDIASVEYAPMTQSTHIFKTSGQSSLILWVTPRIGGNVKKMSEDVIKILNDLKPTLSKDVRFKVLVDPSEFIRSSIHNVLHEVFLAAALAVLVLFLFLGNVKNVITAAIEIPMSIVMAFILMKLTGINLNLISLGGLALSAGMNVDASVVVMENIFRHYHREKGHLLDANGRLKLVIQAVNEVKMPIIASTIASLVVFIPLAFTRDLTNALLGDLARAVIYSHGLSALVALILVPTVRLHILNHTKGAVEEKPAPLEGFLSALERLYSKCLQFFLQTPTLKIFSIVFLSSALVALAVFALPKIQKEIIGTPDSDWLVVDVESSGHNLIRQNEEINAEAENRIMQKFGDEIQYTFCQVNSLNSSQVMVRLKDRSHMNALWKKLEDNLKPTIDVQYYVSQWNPSELPIPKPPDLRISITGNDRLKSRNVAQELSYMIQSRELYQGVDEVPGSEYSQELRLTPHQEQWSLLHLNGVNLNLTDLTDLTRVATEGRYVADMRVRNRYTQVRLYFPHDRVTSTNDVAALPIGIGDRLVPLKALVGISTDEAPPSILREDDRELILLEAHTKRDEQSKVDEYLKQTTKDVENYKATKAPDGVHVVIEDAKIELTTALHQLGIAIAISVALIFCVMVFQLGDIVSALLVLVAIPLGLIGVILAIYVFHSTVSLNSALGIILLNGIAVANSIILVDYMHKLVAAGHRPREAALLSATRRLRPILMTSLTTLLGMLPIAFGIGEGGRILQPLGIAVSGGLFFSTLFTLFLVPALHAAYLEWRLFTFSKPPAPPGANVTAPQPASAPLGIDLDIL